MNDERSTSHVEIAGTAVDIHKLSSWVVGLFFLSFFLPFFSFAIKLVVLTIYNGSLRSVSNLSTPIKDKLDTGS